jgi:RNA polymerase sigma factor (sigma-70 family)
VPRARGSQPELGGGAHSFASGSVPSRHTEALRAAAAFPSHAAVAAGGFLVEWGFGPAPVIRFGLPLPLEERMGLEPDSTPEPGGDAGARVGERLTPVVLRAQAGDPAAIGQVVGELAPGVLRAVRALLGREHPDVEDLAQDVLLAVVAALPDFRGESTLLHFAVRIAARKSVLVRRRTRSVLGWLENLWRGEYPVRQAPSSAHEEMRGERRRALLRSLLSELPDAQAEALGLRVLYGHSVEEISSITHTPFNTVRSRLRLAKEALRQRIEAEPQWAELGQRE